VGAPIERNATPRNAKCWINRQTAGPTPWISFLVAVFAGNAITAIPALILTVNPRDASGAYASSSVLIVLHRTCQISLGVFEESYASKPNNYGFFHSDISLLSENRIYDFLQGRNRNYALIASQSHSLLRQ
jgi:hypothetical protein